ncbi:MAG TPA: DUF2771 domain-containing protein [Streptomyces sp.]|nr:DUF2771 domain-containing protein [Streptomyces sp.]
MSYAISRRGLRTATALGTVTFGLLALSACEKPSPLLTATVNSTSVTTEAACYDEGKTLPAGEAKKCLSEKAAKTVEIGPGDKLRIGVEPETAESGWLLFVDGRPALPDPVKKTYYTFSGDAFFQQQSAGGGTETKKTAQVSIVQAEGGDFKGVWHLKLKHAG